MSADISTSPAKDAVIFRQRQHFLCTALGVAALANALIPAVLFSETQFFGPSDPRYRALVAIVVAAAYATAFLLLLLHANVGFAGGYTFVTAATVTLGSAMLAVINLGSAVGVGARSMEKFSSLEGLPSPSCPTPFSWWPASVTLAPPTRACTSAASPSASLPSSLS